jgi:rhamnogalacturonyl hydrolase YesR
MAWAINNGLISKKDYLPVVQKSWNAMLNESVHPNGFLGWVQGTGKEPKDSQPVGYDNVPNFEDFGLGCFLLAGSEMYKLQKAMEPKEKPEKVKKVKEDGKVGKKKK